MMDVEVRSSRFEVRSAKFLKRNPKSAIQTSSLELRTSNFFLFLALLLLPTGVFADSYAVVLSGVPGSPEHAERFTKWTETTQKVLTEKFGFTPDCVRVISDKKATRPEIEKAFTDLRQRVSPQDTLFMFFIGHGSYDGNDYKFNITGPDLSAADYDTLLTSLNVGRTVIVNGTNSSGAAIDKLSKANRVVLTATRSGHEGNDTVFYGHFLEALESSSSDEDKDLRTSVWEAFRFATQAVERFYKEQGRLATEHPQISDNGGEKSGLNIKEPPALARIIHFQVPREVAVQNPRLQALLDEKKRLEQSIENLRLRKASVDEAEYEKQMEALLVELAVKNRQIREEERKK